MRGHHGLRLARAAVFWLLVQVVEVYAWYDGDWIAALSSWMGIIGFGAAFLAVQRWSLRPVRTYLSVAIASIALAAILAMVVLPSGGSLLLPAVLWGGLTALASFCAVSFENIERGSVIRNV
jgi:hypothetical protein